MMKVNTECRFEKFLVNYQEDLERIVGKYLSKNLHIDVGDVVSTINIQLIKTKQKFFDRVGYDFRKPDFNKWAYAFARNLTKWQTSLYINKDEKLKDGCFYTEDGEKSLFDIASESFGEENEELEESDADAKIKLIEKIINKYSHTLTSSEKQIFSGYLRGETELEMSESCGVTRQAINLTKIRLIEKIRAHFNGLTLDDVHLIEPDKMKESIDSILVLLNKGRARGSTARNPNNNPYIYARD
jgi:RNA polymerase sigma factor (sigma-70 family)